MNGLHRFSTQSSQAWEALMKSGAPLEKTPLVVQSWCMQTCRVKEKRYVTKIVYLWLLPYIKTLNEGSRKHQPTKNRQKFLYSSLFQRSNHPKCITINILNNQPTDYIILNNKIRKLFTEKKKYHQVIQSSFYFKYVITFNKRQN